MPFTGTSTGTPTSWAWDFGDGGTATTQNPSHTYTTPGNYTVKLTATNTTGSTTTSQTGLITATGATSGITVDGSTTTYAGAPATSVPITQPAGTVNGDVLVASITADLDPTMTTVPAGWTPIVTALSINSTATDGARMFSYYHLVNPTDPTTYTRTLSAAEKWGAGITVYHGVNASTPVDSTVATAVNTDWAATNLTIPAVTTISTVALLISGIGLDSAPRNSVQRPPAGPDAGKPAAANRHPSRPTPTHPRNHRTSNLDPQLRTSHRRLAIRPQTRRLLSSASGAPARTGDGNDDPGHARLLHSTLPSGEFHRDPDVPPGRARVAFQCKPWVLPLKVSPMTAANGGLLTAEANSAAAGPWQTLTCQGDGCSSRDPWRLSVR